MPGRRRQSMKASEWAPRPMSAGLIPMIIILPAVSEAWLTLLTRHRLFRRPMAGPGMSMWVGTKSSHTGLLHSAAAILPTAALFRSPVHSFAEVPGNAAKGVDEHLLMAFDYDLWWRLYLRFGELLYVDAFVAANRRHDLTKTTINRREHYSEAMKLVKRYYGRVPVKWYLARPVMVNMWLILQRMRKYLR